MAEAVVVIPSRRQEDYPELAGVTLNGFEQMLLAERGIDGLKGPKWNPVIEQVYARWAMEEMARAQQHAEPFLEVGSHGVTVEFGFHGRDVGRGYDLQIRTDNLPKPWTPAGFMHATGTIKRAANAIAERLARQRMLELYLDSPRLAITGRWQIAPTLVAALTVGPDVLLIASRAAGTLALTQATELLGDRVTSKPRVTQRPGMIVIEREKTIRHVLPDPQDWVGLSPDVLVVSAALARDHELLKHAATRLLARHDLNPNHEPTEAP